ncbi:MAG: coproporphyrinogen dehydrogenase HemZ [Candidatus Merdivicinus sp.]|jgi:oxygen-independent coproporphyrinogen-3 oxidase
MTIFFSGNRFKYEMENVARLFFPLRRFSFVYDSEEYPEADYLAFIRRENVSGGELTVRVREGGFDETAVSQVKMGEGYENACEMEFARMLYRLLQKITGVTPKWGVLTGIRPVKRLQYAMDSGKSRQQAMDEMTEECLVSNEKAQLAMQIADIQKGLLADLEPRDFSLYVSIPYCPSRCSYCSFVSHSIDHPKARKLLPEYLDFLVKEIAFTANLSCEMGLRLRTVYIGGGTPTALTAEQLRQVTNAVREYFDPPENLEYTIEAGRADTITPEKLQVIRDAGANRISINPQTFEDSVLEAVGRRHTANQVVECYQLARGYGFEAINMDLIAGLPTDTLEGFRRSLDRAVALGPENITVHALSVKRAADLFAEMDGNEDYRAVQAMVDYTGKAMTAAGYLPYYLYRQKNTVGNLENVGYAKPGYFGKYNVYIMEEVQSILAVGAGGVSKIVRPGRIDRVFNYKYPYEYLARFSDILTRKDALRGMLKGGLGDGDGPEGTV